MPNTNQQDYVQAIISATILFVVLAAFLIAFIIIYLKRRNQHKNEMTQLKHRFAQELLKSQLEIQEETLRHIIGEIHDNIGQVLSLAKLQLNTLPVAPPDENREAIEQSKRLVSKAITDLRELSKSMHPDRMNELGLEENIRQELEMLERTKLYQSRLQLNGSMYKLPVDRQTILFRIIQEALSNIIRHAGAKRVDVVIDYEPRQFSLTIQDDGHGFDVSNQKISAHKGIGLRNMESRSNLIGALFLIRSSPETGTSIFIKLPIPA